MSPNAPVGQDPAITDEEMVTFTFPTSFLREVEEMKKLRERESLSQSRDKFACSEDETLRALLPTHRHHEIDERNFARRKMEERLRIELGQPNLHAHWEGCNCDSCKRRREEWSSRPERSRAAWEEVWKLTAIEIKQMNTKSVAARDPYVDMLSWEQLLRIGLSILKIDVLNEPLLPAAQRVAAWHIAEKRQIACRNREDVKKAHGKTRQQINELIEAELKRNPKFHVLSARQWAKKLECGASMIVRCDSWKRIMKDRDRACDSRSVETIPESGQLVIASKSRPVPDQIGEGSDTLPAHAKDFSSIKCPKGEFHFTPAQRPVIEVLWADWEQGGQGLGHGYLLEQHSRRGMTMRLRDVFKRNPAWGKIVVRGERKDVYRLELGCGPEKFFEENRVSLQCPPSVPRLPQRAS